MGGPSILRSAFPLVPPLRLVIVPGLAGPQNKEDIMSNQNPIHRDRGRRDNIEGNRIGNKEAFTENEARIEREASIPPDQGESLTSEEQTELLEQAAEKRFAEIGEEQGEKSSTD